MSIWHNLRAALAKGLGGEGEWWECPLQKREKCLYFGRGCEGMWWREKKEKYCRFYASKEKYHKRKAYVVTHYAQLSPFDQTVWRKQYLSWCRKNFLVPRKLPPEWQKAFEEYWGKDSKVVMESKLYSKITPPPKPLKGGQTTLDKLVKK